MTSSITTTTFQSVFRVKYISGLNHLILSKQLYKGFGDDGVEINKLLNNHLKKRKVKYINHLIFNHINDISKQLYKGFGDDGVEDGKQRSLKGRDIIKLPRLEMISHFAMPWNFLCHYLPKDYGLLLYERMQRVIIEYCHHPNATLDTLEHLLEWSQVDIDWDHLNIYPNDKTCQILEYLVEICSKENGENRSFLNIAMRTACEKNYLSTVKLIDSFKDVQLDESAMNIASMYGSVDIVKYLHENRTEGCTSYAMDDAAGGGHLNVVKFLHFHRTEGCSEFAMDGAAQNGHLEIFLHQHRTEGCTIDTIEFVSQNGHIDVLKFLQENRSETETTTNAMDYAAKNGHIEIVSYLQEHRTEGASTDAIDEAARNGHIEVVKYLYEHRGEDVSPGVIDDAAKNGHIEVVKYLSEYSSEGATTNAMDMAAKNGHIGVVQYLHQHRSEGATTYAMDGAAEKGHIDVVRYLHEHRSEGATTYAMNEAAENGHTNVVEFLHFNRTEGASTNAMDGAAQNGHIDVVKFLQEHRSEGATTYAMDYAAENGHFEVVKYLHFNRSEGATTDAMDLAARLNHIDIVKFLHFNQSEGCDRAIEFACGYGHLDIYQITKTEKAVDKAKAFSDEFYKKMTKSSMNFVNYVENLITDKTTSTREILGFVNVEDYYIRKDAETNFITLVLYYLDEEVRTILDWTKPTPHPRLLEISSSDKVRTWYKKYALLYAHYRVSEDAKAKLNIPLIEKAINKMASSRIHSKQLAAIFKFSYIERNPRMVLYLPNATKWLGEVKPFYLHTDRLKEWEHDFKEKYQKNRAGVDSSDYGLDNIKNTLDLLDPTGKSSTEVAHYYKSSQYGYIATMASYENITRSGRDIHGISVELQTNNIMNQIQELEKKSVLTAAEKDYFKIYKDLVLAAGDFAGLKSLLGITIRRANERIAPYVDIKDSYRFDRFRSPEFLEGQMRSVYPEQLAKVPKGINFFMSLWRGSQSIAILNNVINYDHKKGLLNNAQVVGDSVSMVLDFFTSFEKVDRAFTTPFAFLGKSIAKGLAKFKYERVVNVLTKGMKFLAASSFNTFVSTRLCPALLVLSSALNVIDIVKDYEEGDWGSLVMDVASLGLNIASIILLVIGSSLAGPLCLLFAGLTLLFGVVKEIIKKPELTPAEKFMQSKHVLKEYILVPAA
ncbi:hypothetical protein DFA_04354 [Cavenderia fasciculata]|uniref:Ankyrin repeat-containing protein n=1 Tax=Cavenderia fasciculata TaxID=261658 RepID=F4PPC3_CACFS|nr:uncharacterized protein DFA_04354 [Cavenderia fasciculata]EGG22236.1 hypothetical protein DFA_04354 [Cavenderia fasciculata]|eukprot:XP_004360087.1 hypothetical protein DFA_04354 [Cavenderia fasciculata]